MKPIFISGIGTGIGKTLVSAVFTEALQADYWKPVQAGKDPDTDSERLASLVNNKISVIHPETYLLELAASPHIAARKENRRVMLSSIAEHYDQIVQRNHPVAQRSDQTLKQVNQHAQRNNQVAHRSDQTLKQEDQFTGQNNLMHSGRPLVIEGAGGLMVPLNEAEFVADLVKCLDARLVLVSRNYLGSINHSLMTARICRDLGLDVAGWVFNDQYLDYAEEIAGWSGYPVLFSLPQIKKISKELITKLAREHAPACRQAL